MQVKFLCTGKTSDAWLAEGINLYRDRLKHYIQFELAEISLPGKFQGLLPAQKTEKEAGLIMPHVTRSDYVVLLDERGKTFRSVEFALFLQRLMNQSVRNLLFVAGGPWGFSSSLNDAAQMKMSLSAMTFPHHMVRLFFVEQLYRAMTILRNEQYHNE